MSRANKIDQTEAVEALLEEYEGMGEEWQVNTKPLLKCPCGRHWMHEVENLGEEPGVDDEIIHRFINVTLEN